MKTQLFTFLIKSTFFFFRFLPRSGVLILGCILGFLLRSIGFKKKRVIMNLNIVYGSKEQWPEKILTNIYRHFGLLLAELLKHPSIAKDKYREITSFEGENYLDEALKKNQGVIMVSGHTGNWEYNMAALAERGYTVNVVV